MPRDRHTVSYALFMLNYSPVEGRVLFLKDLFVLHQYRGTKKHSHHSLVSLEPCPGRHAPTAPRATPRCSSSHAPPLLELRPLPLATPHCSSTHAHCSSSHASLLLELRPGRHAPRATPYSSRPHIFLLGHAPILCQASDHAPVHYSY